MTVGSSAVTPVAVMRRLNVRRSASPAWSTSTPAKPLTCRSSQPRQAIPVSPGGNPTAVTTHR